MSPEPTLTTVILDQLQKIDGKSDKQGRLLAEHGVKLDVIKEEQTTATQAIKSLSGIIERIDRDQAQCEARAAIGHVKSQVAANTLKLGARPSSSPRPSWMDNSHVRTGFYVGGGGGVLLAIIEIVRYLIGQ